jgi:CRISPR-associated protein Cas6
MRMYNPEWEAIKDFEHTTRVRDVQFDLTGSELPADHGVTLYRELVRHLPWLEQTPEAGVHPVHGWPTGRNANLVINRRIKLVLRLPVERVEDARALVGSRIDPGAGPITIGPLKVRPLTPYATLYSHLVVMGPEDEAAFLAEARRELEHLGIQCGLIAGKHRKISVPDGKVSGYSLMLHDVSLMQSITVQEQGLGRYRGYGCGIFIPHKSIKEVVID